MLFTLNAVFRYNHFVLYELLIYHHWLILPYMLIVSHIHLTIYSCKIIYFSCNSNEFCAYIKCSFSLKIYG